MELTVKGRRLIELTLDSCQQRRPAEMQRRLDYYRLCDCLTEWGYLTPHVDIPTLGKIFLFSKHKTHDVKLGAGWSAEAGKPFKMVETPLDVSYVDFERLLAREAAPRRVLVGGLLCAGGSWGCARTPVRGACPPGWPGRTPVRQKEGG